jgi:hypothetical protein
MPDLTDSLVADTKFGELILVMLNLFQHPSRHTNGGAWGEMDPETSSG